LIRSDRLRSAKSQFQSVSFPGNCFQLATLSVFPVSMTSNRRNYYRLLHVQPDAAAEVIKASYRALMTLHHPDVGGDHATAVLINEAYAVLSDPARRAAYDAQRAAKAGRQTFREQRGETSGAKPAPHPAASSGLCPLCQVVLPTRPPADGRCARCRAPLGAVRRSATNQRANERRGIPRVTKSDWAKLHPDWQAQGIEVRMRDLSLDGISIYSGVPLPPTRISRSAPSSAWFTWSI
jgi:curved DNA-binding protein CbpA